MTLKEVYRFQYKTLNFIILESKTKERKGETWYQYWLTTPTNGRIEHILGQKEKETDFASLKDYILYDGDFDLLYETLTGEDIEWAIERNRIIKERKEV